MAAPRFLASVLGRIKMIATIATSVGSADAEKVPSTNAAGVLDPSLLNAAATGANKIPILDASGRLDPTTMPAGIGQDAKTMAASEALAAGNIVNVWNDASTAKARKADATAEGKEGVGFVLAAVASAANATVFFEGRITGLSGLTGGARYYLSAATPGALVLAANLPTAAGSVIQYIGTAVSPTELDFEPGEPVTIA